LFRFELRGSGIDFVLNETIAADMYPDVDEELTPLVHACCETLLRYKHLSVSNTIMDGNLLATGGFEVMLSKGLDTTLRRMKRSGYSRMPRHLRSPGDGDGQKNSRAEARKTTAPTPIDHQPNPTR